MKATLSNGKLISDKEIAKSRNFHRCIPLNYDNCSYLATIYQSHKRFIAPRMQPRDFKQWLVISNNKHDTAAGLC